MELATLTWPEAADLAAAGALLAVPVGSTEQPVPDLALSTDTDPAVALCARLARAALADTGPGILALPPGQVRLDRAQAGDVRPIADLLPLLRVSSVRGVSPDGVLGDPAGASAAGGEALLTALLADLQGRIENWRPDRGDTT